MMKRILTKNGVLFVQESALNNEYTASKLELLTSLVKPLNKLNSEELSELVFKVLGKTVKPSQCKQCSRNRWVSLLKSYQDVCTKILSVRAEQTDTETETTDTEEKTTEDKPKETKEEPTEEPKEEKKKPTEKKKGSKK